jgi:hypothetical protein
MEPKPTRFEAETQPEAPRLAAGCGYRAKTADDLVKWPLAEPGKTAGQPFVARSRGRAGGLLRATPELDVRAV